MNAAEPFLPVTLIRPLGWFMALLAAATVCALLLFQSLQQHDIIVGTLETSSGVSLLQRLEQLDIDYRIGRDGSVKADNRYRERLAEAGVIPTDDNLLPLRLYQAVLLMVLLLLAVLMVVKARRVVVLLRQGEAGRDDSTISEVHEAVLESDTKAIRTATPVQMIGIHENEWRVVLENEHPQVIAIYLLGLPSKEAAEAMEALDVPLRDAVWERMAFSGECDSELENAVQVLVSQKREAMQIRKRPAERTEKMASIYRLLSNDTRQAFLAALRKANPDDPLLELLTEVH